MSARTARWIAWSLVGAFIILATAGLSLQAISQHTYAAGTPIVVLIIAVILVGMWVVTGALIISRHPRHPVGWLLCAGMFSPAIDMFSAGYAAYDTFVYPGSLSGVNLALVWLKLSSLGAFGTAAFALILLLFPDGRPPSPRWRVVTWTAIGTLILYLSLQALEPGPINFLPGRIYPFGVSASLWTYLEPLRWMAISILMLCYAAALLSLVSRLRRAWGDERQQVKWLIFPASLYWISLILLYFFGEFMADELIAEVFLSVAQAAVAGMVIAIAFSIFKYRLYDIDIIINRTLVYSVLTGSLALIYFASVALLQGILPAESPIAIVLSTLAIAALFSPLRRRIQNTIDKRFYRRKYDAQQTLAAFSAQMRDEVELEQLSEALLSVADETMQPTHVSLWLKEVE